MTSHGPTGSRELFGIQILRGLAALCVVFHHTLEESYGASAGARSPDWLTTSGAAGVDIFFVISGFIMLYVSFPPGRAALTPGDFLLRRVTRIYPLYWTCCAAVLVLSAIGLFASKTLSAGTVLKSIFLVPTPDTLIDVSWTLSFEIYFYLVFAASLRFRSSAVSVLMSTTVIIGIIIASRLMFVGNLAQFFANPISVEFCFGLLLAYVCKIRLRNKTAIWVSIFGFAVIATAPLYVPHASTNALPEFARIIVWGLPAALILFAFLSVRPPKGVGSRFAVLVGDASYSIYLTHAFVMVAYAKALRSTLLGSQSQIAIVPIVICACVAIGLAVHVLIERPILTVIRDIFRRKMPLTPRTEAS